MSETSSNNKVYIALGDIIDITAPEDSSLHDKRFFVEYIDKTLIKIRPGPDETITLLINDNGDFSNESIISVSIESSAESPSYAIQNDYTPGKWIDVLFNSDIPLVVTGEITNLEKDIIEIKSVDGDIFFIDFAYQGIPLNMPIEITIRDAPPIIPGDEPINVGEIKGKEGEEEIMTPIEEDAIRDNFKAKITKLIMSADELNFGVDLDEISELIDLPESQQRFGIDKQTADMLDDLLASIPNIKRTPKVMNSIHMMIERFLQLRKEFSLFDDYNNAIAPKKIGADHKPLVDSLEVFKQKLYWIIPLVKNSKKIYDENDVFSDNIDGYSDVTSQDYKTVIQEQSDIVNQYEDESHTQSDNKYIELQRKLDPLYKPYKDPRNKKDILAIVKINAPITSITNNTDDYNTTVVKNKRVSSKRFFTQEHVMGQTILTEHKTKISTELRRTTIIPNDELHVTSLLTLREPVVRFSRVNLPSTDIVTKTNLGINFLAYWRLLRKKTTVNTQIISDKNVNIHEDGTYLRSNTEYIPEIESLSYRKYLEKIIPKTRVLFDLIKSHINNNLSVYEILKYMEPFMIYQKDITFTQYKEVTDYISNKINDVKAKYNSTNKTLSALNVKSLSYKSKILGILARYNETILNAVTQAYGINTPTNNPKLSDGEMYRIFEDYDGCELYNTAISLVGISLIVPNGVSQIEAIKENMKPTEDSTSDCSKYVIAKKYLALYELESDNDINPIYYDKKYDPTYYELIKDYKSVLDDMDVDDITGKLAYIAERLRENNGLSNNKAIIEAKAIYYKKREVEEGEYAVLDDLNGTGMRYYRRVGTNWDLDNKLDDSDFSDDTKLFCNLNEKCVTIANNCEDFGDGKTNINKTNIKIILEEFDDELQKSSEDVINTINLKYNKAIDNLKQLIKIKENKRLINNEKQMELGVVLEENIRASSPYEKLRDTILGITDLSEKQSYISKFVNTYTRPANDGEDEWWLYCIASDIRLIPTFLHKLSTAYLNSIDEYIMVMNEIVSDQGEKSDDEAYVVDKYSGYNIRPITFDTQEGFTESGFQIKSRDVLEADYNYSSQSEIKQMSFDNEEAEKIYNVAKAMSKFIGVDITPYIELIMRNTVLMLGKVMPSKEIFDKMQATKKKPVTYENALNTQLIMITLSYFLVSIQTSIPSVKTRKRFPGCKKSFTGFPMGGEEDTGALMYIACIARKIKSDQSPWSAIKKSKEESIADKMKYMLDKYILPTEECKKLLRKKNEYMRTNPDEEIPYSISVKKWKTFLPHLDNVKLSTFQQTSKAFDEELINNYKKGDKRQHEQLNILRAKIIYSSLKIQEHIHKVVYNKTAILSNSISEPFLENACCDSDNNITIDYFTNRAPEIAELNDYVNRTQDLLDDMDTLKKANTLVFPTDTKLKYPDIPNDYSTQTIYKAFIYHCNIGSPIPIREEIRAICGEKPGSFNNQADIGEQITSLKNEGLNYTNANLNQLVNIINRQNIVNLVFGRANLDNISTIREIIESENQQTETILPKQFIIKFQAMIDNYERGVLMEESKEMEDMKDYLFDTNEMMETIIIDFMKTNSKPHSKIIECLKTINEFSQDGERVNDDDVYKMINYMKLTIKSICRLFPNMIKHRVGIKNITPPTHWKLSNKHNTDFSAIISKYYGGIDGFYNDAGVELVLDRIFTTTQVIYELSENTLYNAPIERGNNKFYSVFDRNITMLLFKFYFFTVILEHIKILKDGTVINNLASIDRNDKYAPNIEASSDPDDDWDIEFIDGIKESTNQKIASLIDNYANIICTHKNEINYSYEHMMSRVNQSREKEKDTITGHLRGLTDEQREIQNYFKNHKLGSWNKGIQKGVRIYQKDTYDQEREAMNQQIISDIKISKNDAVNDMIREIYDLDNAYDSQEANRIEREEYSMHDEYEVYDNDDNM
tara:strand:+ start:30 stop:5795 length:5766 start_codon:yes stop_codon:yes gene_type:complete